MEKINTSKRKRREEALRASEERHVFLLKLSDAIHPLSNAVDIRETVTRVAMDYFETDRCYYCEIEGDVVIIRRDARREDLPSVSNVYSLSEMPLLKSISQNGRPVVVRDVNTSEVMDDSLKRLCLSVNILSYINVPVLKDDRLVGCFCLAQDTRRDWTDVEADLAKETAERAWAAVERARVEQALRASEEKYRTLFESIDEGFCVIEVIFDPNGKAFDLLHLEANEAYERYTGLRNIVGARAREIVPDGGPWLDFYGNVALTGEPARLEAYLPPGVDRWISSFASRVGGEGSRKVAVVFNDITERMRREAHQSLLVEIGDDLSRLVTPDEIMQAVGSRLGEYLNLGACVFVDVDEGRGEVTVHHGWNKEGVPSLKQTFRMAEYLTDEFARASRAGETFVVRDTATDARVDADAYARLNIGAWLAVPFHREGRWTASLSVTGVAPRDWRDDEIELVRNIADRVFPRIERARAEAALRASLAEREGLLKELHHRVKNNLQVITSLLEMQSRNVNDPKARTSLAEAQRRIGSIASIHELLYQSGSFSRVELANYARRLVPHLVSLYQAEERIKVSVVGDDVLMDLERAVPCGLLLNELVTNVCKHALPPPLTGALTVELQQYDGHIRLQVRDTGVGLPAGFDYRKSASLGLQLVHLLAKQLGGSVVFQSGRGLSVEARLPSGQNSRNA
jgi:two-component sensor histidine kinase/PAS domain-containing protein